MKVGRRVAERATQPTRVPLILHRYCFPRWGSTTTGRSGAPGTKRSDYRWVASIVILSSREGLASCSQMKPVPSTRPLALCPAIATKFYPWQLHLYRFVYNNIKVTPDTAYRLPVVLRSLAYNVCPSCPRVAAFGRGIPARNYRWSWMSTTFRT